MPFIEAPQQARRQIVERRRVAVVADARLFICIIYLFVPCRRAFGWQLRADPRRNRRCDRS
jgi:hypothetical protein